MVDKKSQKIKSVSVGNGRRVHPSSGDSVSRSVAAATLTAADGVLRRRRLAAFDGGVLAMVSRRRGRREASRLASASRLVSASRLADGAWREAAQSPRPCGGGDGGGSSPTRWRCLVDGVSATGRRRRTITLVATAPGRLGDEGGGGIAGGGATPSTLWRRQRGGSSPTR